MRSRAWTDFSTKPNQTISVEAKRWSKEKVERVFGVAKKAFESGNPNEVRNEVTAEVLMEFMSRGASCCTWYTRGVLYSFRPSSPIDVVPLCSLLCCIS